MLILDENFRWHLETFDLNSSYIVLGEQAHQEIGTGVKPLKEHSTFFENRLIFQLPNS